MKHQMIFYSMLNTLVRFFTVFSAALVMGTVFGVWLAFNPFSLSPGAYVEQQQNMIRAMNVLMPRLGGMTIVLTLINAFIHRKLKLTFALLLIATACFVASGLITAYGNQVINAVVITWDPKTPPAEWTVYRDEWWSLHSYRTLTSLIGMTMVILVNTNKGYSRGAAAVPN